VLFVCYQGRLTIGLLSASKCADVCPGTATNRLGVVFISFMMLNSAYIVTFAIGGIIATYLFRALGTYYSVRFSYSPILLLFW
jgi:hypothetical protein